MSIRSCCVAIQDMDGVSHTVEVTAATQCEARSVRTIKKPWARLNQQNQQLKLVGGCNAINSRIIFQEVEGALRGSGFVSWRHRTVHTPESSAVRGFA
jgi:hypothetical protein